MQSVQERIAERVSAALRAVGGDAASAADPLVRPAQDPRFGDYQSNVALALAPRLGRKPRELAEAIVAQLDLAGLAEPPEIAGPGFINFRVSTAYLAATLTALQADPRLGIPPVSAPERIVVDFSSPNVAKEMHVGHLPSTIIGDTFARLLEFQGHDVVRLNHIGDWGTQFGMLIQFVREARPEVLDHPDRFEVDDLEGFYLQAKQRFDGDPEFAEKARRAVVELQAGDPAALQLWEAFCRESLRHAHALYARLSVRLEDRGESFYNCFLAGMVDDLQAQGVVREDQGALCAFPAGFKGRDGTPQPLIVQKSDGGFMYATTDLAAIRHRVQIVGARRIIYVTDIRQRDHFQMVFDVARQGGYAPPDVDLQHVGFGMVLGADRKPFKTREGGTVKLKVLLDEAEERALAIVNSDEERQAKLSTAQREHIARAVGLGAVKYATLNHNITTDWVFDWDTLLAMEGNSAPYLQMAYTRVRGIGRKGEIDYDALPPDLPILVEHPSEAGLAKELLRFPTVVRQVAAELRPHPLTDYLYDLSRAFSTFFDRVNGVRVLNAETPELRLSRLRLCDLTARTLALGLSLLGIEVLEQM